MTKQEVKGENTITKTRYCSGCGESDGDER